MASELIALVAEAIIDNPPIEMMTDDEIIIDWSPTGKAVAATILAALQEQFANVEKDPFIPQGAKNYIRKFLAASALGEQSE